MEMLTDPAMLILDEPTAGLDPSLVLQIMTLLRRLADARERVFLVTHDLDHLDLVDQVLVLRAGGTAAYYGPPDGISAHFGTSTHGPRLLGARGRRAEVSCRPEAGGEASGRGLCSARAPWGSSGPARQRRGRARETTPPDRADPAYLPPSSGHAGRAGSSRPGGAWADGFGRPVTQRVPKRLGCWCC